MAAHPGHAASYVGRTVYGYPSYRYGKRSADPVPHGVVGMAIHHIIMVRGLLRLMLTMADMVMVAATRVAMDSLWGEDLGI